MGAAEPEFVEGFLTEDISTTLKDVMLLSLASMWFSTIAEPMEKLYPFPTQFGGMRTW